MAPIKTQRGGTLILGLVILLVMSIMGITGMNISAIEEKMSANARDRDLAFQAADSALRAGEACITAQADAPNILDPSTFTCNTLAPGKGFYPASPKSWDPLTAGTAWNDPEKAVQFPGNLADITVRPSYVVEQVGVDCGAKAGSCKHPWRTFRITAHATGGTTEAVAIVQSTVRRQ